MTSANNDEDYDAKTSIHAAMGLVLFLCVPLIFGPSFIGRYCFAQVECSVCGAAMAVTCAAAFFIAMAIVGICRDEAYRRKIAYSRLKYEWRAKKIH